MKTRWSGSALTTSVGLTGGKVLVSTASSLSAVITARLLGPSDRGVLALEITVVSFTMLLLTFGIPMAARLHLVADDDRMPLGAYIGLGLALTVLQGAICVVSGALLLPIVDVTLSPPEMLALVAYGMAILGAQLLLTGLYAYGYFVHAASCESGGAVVSLGATFALAAAGVEQVSPYLVALAIGPTLQFLVGLLILETKGHGVRPRYAPLAWSRLVRTGVPGLGLSPGQSATYRVDRYIVGLYLTPAAVGLYSVAATVTEVCRLSSISVGQVLFHRLAAARLAVHRARLIYRAGMAVCTAMAAILFMISPWAVRVVFGPDYAGSVTPLRILLLGELAIGSYLLDGSSLGGRNRLARASRATLVGFFLVTASDLLLIPRYGIIGAAWASVVGYWGMAILARFEVVRLERAEEARLSGHDEVPIPPTMDSSEQGAARE